MRHQRVLKRQISKFDRLIDDKRNKNKVAAQTKMTAQTRVNQ